MKEYFENMRGYVSILVSGLIALLIIAYTATHNRHNTHNSPNTQLGDYRVNFTEKAKKDNPLQNNMVKLLHKDAHPLQSERHTVP